MQHRPELDRWILAEVKSLGGAVLDVGCGLGRNGFLLWEDGAADPRIGVDLDSGYLQRAASLGIYTGLVRVDLHEGLPLTSSSVDTVVCSDVVTQLAKEKGLALIGECERVARRGVVLVVQTGHLGEHPENPLESHQSTWTIKELRGLGYDVRAFGSRLSRNRHGGWKFLAGWYAGTLLARVLPAAGDELLCVRSFRE